MSRSEVGFKAVFVVIAGFAYLMFDMAMGAGFTGLAFDVFGVTLALSWMCGN